jgi:LPXTG-motif cell wall-anchored protein
MDDVQGRHFGGRRHLPFVAVIGLALVVVVSASSALADSTVEMVEGSATDINSWGFMSPEVTIAAGESVTWTNKGNIAHTATATGGAFDTGNVAPGESKTVTLATAGTYAYQCTPHPWMKGTITVTAAAAAPAPAAPAAAPKPAAAPAAPAAAPVAQAVPTPTPFRFVSPTGATTTAPASTAPRAGGIPTELVLPLLAGGASALGGGLYLLRRRRN